jgi:hypothetical protein
VDGLNKEVRIDSRRELVFLYEAHLKVLGVYTWIV